MGIDGTVIDNGAVLVTGGAGFLGSALVRRLVAAGVETHTVDLPGLPRERLAPCGDAVRVHEGDLCDAAFVLRVMEQTCPAVVFHCAAAGVSDQAAGPAVLATNTLAALNLVAAIAACPVRRFVNTGSCFEYGLWDAARALGDAPDALTHYAASKVLVSDLCASRARQDGLPVVTLRPYCLYGPGELPHRILSAAIEAVQTGETLPMTDGLQVRDFLYVEDAVDAYLACLAVDGDYPVAADIASGTEVSIREAVALVEDVMGRTGNFAWGARPRRAFEPAIAPANLDHTRAVLGWTAMTPLRQGIEQMLAVRAGNR